jgi:hypothetical protein
VNWISLTHDLRGMQGMPSMQVIEGGEPIVRIEFGIGTQLCVMNPEYLDRLAAAAVAGAVELRRHRQAGEPA